MPPFDGADATERRCRAGHPASLFKPGKIMTTERSSNSKTTRARRGGRQETSAGSRRGSRPPAERDPGFAATPEINRRIAQLDSGGDPMSLAEQIAHEYNFDLEVSPGSDDHSLDSLSNITLLQRMGHDQLVEAAEAEGVVDARRKSRSELVLGVIKMRLRMHGMMYGEGTLEVLPDGYGFLRSSDHNYRVCMDDIYVSPSQIRKFNLRTGSLVCGQIRPPKETERYFALLRIASINGAEPLQAARHRTFDELTPLHPSQRIVMEYDPAELSTRVIDLLTPIGFGQRGLIVSPPRAGKTMLMQAMARAVLHNHPDAYVIMLLVDERPEEVTDMEREVRSPRCEVISSTFDEKTNRHIQVADIVLEKAKRMVEAGCDVVVFLDSITRLGRAWNQECPQTGKTLTGGLDAGALQKPKAFFGSARKVEEGGSLTILATALIDTGSRMDDIIFEEFKGTGNLEIVLDQSLVERRIWPAIDVNRSGTRREEKLMAPEEFERVCLVRRVLSQLNPPDAMDQLTARLKKTKTNAEFLMGVTPGRI
jgi:transcription termination factor Rho